MWKCTLRDENKRGAWGTGASKEAARAMALVAFHEAVGEGTRIATEEYTSELRDPFTRLEAIALEMADDNADLSLFLRGIFDGVQTRTELPERGTYGAAYSVGNKAGRSFKKGDWR